MVARNKVSLICEEYSVLICVKLEMVTSIIFVSYAMMVCGKTK